MIKPDIVVVGSCNIDFFFYTKHIPKRGQTIYGTKFMNSFGGKGGNQCIAATKLGATTAMIGRLGNDHFGKEYFNLFKKLNVNTNHLILTEGESSGIAQITVSETEGDNYILIVEGANGLLCPKDVQNAIDVIQHAKVGLFQFEVSIKTTIEAMKLFKSTSKAKLILNPSPAMQDVDPIIFKLLDVIVLNESEAEGLSNQEVKTVKDGCNVIKHFLELGCETVIITLGRSGTVFATQKEREPVHVKVEPIDNPVDPTGAGDLFTGALAYSFVYKSDLKLSEKIKFACNIARECVKRPGAFSDEDDKIKNKPKVPDGGWGWMIVLSSFVISMIADGISFSFGLLYIRFLKYFKESKSTTSWIGSLFMAVPLMSGPIGSALVDRFGCRWMTIAGGIVSGTGFILSSFCDTILMMYITFGVIAGLGLGLCYVTAVVSIAYWFDKKRSLAIGLGACGTGVGTVVYAPMTQYFIEEYGWRGTVIMLAGTFLNMCVCGALMRDPEWWTAEQQKSSGLSKSNRGSSRVSLATAADIQALEEIKEMLKSGESPEYVLTQLATNIAKSPIPTIPEEEAVVKNAKPNVQSVYNLPTFVRQHEKVPLEVLASLSSNNKVFNVILENYPSLLTCRSLSDNGKLNIINDKVIMKPTSRVPVKMRVTTTHAHQTGSGIPSATTPDGTTTTPLLPSSVNAVIGKITKDDSKVFPLDSSAPVLKKKFSVPKADHHHYLKDIRVHRNTMMYRGAVLNTYKYHLRASSCPNIYRNSMTTLAKETEESWKTELKEMIANMCDFSMFLELHFMFLSVGTILLFTWFIVPYFYLAEHMTRHNYSENEASNIISIIGLTNTIGMVGLGYLGDQPWVDVTKAYASCLIACGVATCGMPFFTDNYWLLVTSAALWGLFFASNFSFTPPIIVKLIPLERFTTAYGLMLLCQGIGNLLGPPLAGWVFDITGYWDWSFYLAGFWIFVSGILVALIPVTENRIIWGSGTLERDKDSIA